MIASPKKPSYSTSKSYLWVSAGSAWAVIFALTIGATMGSEQAVGLAAIAFPSMAALIAGTLGIHRHYGSKDFAVAAEEQPMASEPSE